MAHINELKEYNLQIQVRCLFILNILFKAYFHMNEGEMQLVRQTLLGSFQDLRIKVR